MINGSTLRDAILSGAHNIGNHKTAINDLNIFPVPDGDTGTNMSMTIGAAASELQKKCGNFRGNRFENGGFSDAARSAG